VTTTGPAADVASRLGLGPEEASFAARLDLVGPPPYEVRLPRGAEAAEILARLGVAPEDASEVIDSLPTPSRTPEWWWLLERACHCVTMAIGHPEMAHRHWPSWDGPADRVSRRRRLFPAHLFLAALPHTIAWHRSRGIPEEISWASLADLGRHMALHRRMFNTAGVDAFWWITFCLRAELYDLGRLQYNLFTLGQGDESPPWYPPDEAERLGPGFREGDSCLGIHIPESGPLTPEACGESLEMARGFFEEFFPTRADRRLATCWSWLLDDQLEDWLPADSNIVQFQRRFELVPGWSESDLLLSFVFRRPDIGDIDSLPQRSTLERAAVALVRAGGRWRVRTGWLDP
jgi:hypothetical protein